MFLDGGDDDFDDPLLSPDFLLFGDPFLGKTGILPFTKYRT
jgi:hypothetical protein